MSGEIRNATAAALAAATGLMSGCASTPGPSGAPGEASGVDAIQPLQRGVLAGRFARADITESSGLAASVERPGVYWTLNDSGGAPVVYAFDITGRDLGAATLTGAVNIDWESMAMGPCTAFDADVCLYVGDTGDNAELRRFVSIYQTPAPQRDAGPMDTVIPEDNLRRVDFAYEDGARDVEGLYVSSDGAVWLVSKGRSQGVRLYRLAPETWASGERAVARLQAVLADDVDADAGERVTGAALSPDGAALAVLSYATLTIFSADPETGAPHLDVAPTQCDVRPLEAAQGEAVAWSADGESLVLTSERRAGQIFSVDCPAPPSGRS